VQAALAAPVTVTFTTASGSSPQDTIVIFDPLNTQPPPGHDAASIDQVDKRFVLRTRTTVTFPNSDHIRHQVYSFSPAKVFTLKPYAGSPSAPETFDKPGLVILGCNIHDRMVALLGVVDTPYFAEADASGTTVLNLPAGRYRLRVWNPGLTTPLPPREITVDKVALAVPLNPSIDSDPAAIAGSPE